MCVYASNNNVCDAFEVFDVCVVCAVYNVCIWDIVYI